MQQMKTARSLYSANQNLLSKMDEKQGQQLAEVLNGNNQNIDEVLKNAMAANLNQLNPASKLEISELKNKVNVSEQKIKQLEYEIRQLKTEIDYLKNTKH